MKLRLLSLIIAIACLFFGLVASLSHGGTLVEVQALGNMLLIVGAIIVAAVLISSAIVESTGKKY